MELSLLGAALIGVGAFYAVLRYEAGRTNVLDCTRDLWDRGLAAAVAGVAAGRLAAMVQGGTSPLSHPGDILIVRSGVSTGVAAIAALATLVVMSRRNLWIDLDAIAPTALAGLAGWHAGCLARSACLGSPTDLPWSWAQAGSDITRHPVGIYTAILLLMGTVVAVWAKRRSPTPGAVAGAALAWAGASRLVTEPLRPVIGRGPEIWYLLAIIAGVLFAWSRQHRSRLPVTDTPG